MKVLRSTELEQEKALVKGLRAGEEGAFRQMVAQYQQLVGNVCFGFVQQQQDAEEVVQEVFVEVYRKISQFREEARFSTWLYRIAVNRSLNFLAARKRRRRFRLSGLLTGAEEGLPQVPAKQRSAQEELEAEDLRRALRAALERLPERQQIAFVLRKYEDMSYQQIAGVLDCSVSSVESLIHRATRNLRKHLQRPS